MPVWARQSGHSLSLPAWGVWIEIVRTAKPCAVGSGRSPHGECGLKWNLLFMPGKPSNSRSPHGECGLKSTLPPRLAYPCSRRSPHGECGLKLEIWWQITIVERSLPAWGVWIEMRLIFITVPAAPSRSPHGECGLKCAPCAANKKREQVAPRMGSVD